MSDTLNSAGRVCLLTAAGLCAMAFLLLERNAGAADPEQVARILAKANPPEQVEACREKPRHIRIQVEGVRREVGVITADLHGDDPDKWMIGKQKIDRERWPATPGTTEICFTVAQPGTYAVALYHDLDASGRLETNLLGSPKEPFGSSNNPTIVVAPPSHAEAAFEVPEAGVELTIQLKHGFAE